MRYGMFWIFTYTLWSGIKKLGDHKRTQTFGCCCHITSHMDELCAYKHVIYAYLHWSIYICKYVLRTCIYLTIIDVHVGSFPSPPGGFSVAVFLFCPAAKKDLSTSLGYTICQARIHNIPVSSLPL